MRPGADRRDFPDVTAFDQDRLLGQVDRGADVSRHQQQFGAARRQRPFEDREEFTEAMHRIGLQVPTGGFAGSIEEALEIVEETGYPAIIRPSFTLGGTGGGIAYNRKEFEAQVRKGLDASPITEVLVENAKPVEFGQPLFKLRPA